MKRTITSTWSNKTFVLRLLGFRCFGRWLKCLFLVFQDSSGVESLSVLKNSLVHTFIGLTIGSFIAAKVSEKLY